LQVLGSGYKFVFEHVFEHEAQSYIAKAKHEAF
jgi:hypothetical protein